MARISLFTLVLISCLCSALSYGEHNLIVGRRGYNDLILYERTVSKSKSWNPWGTVSEDVKYPVNYVPLGKKFTITEIDAIDMIGNNNGGFASITKGGISRSNVTVHFKSQRGKGYNFHLTIYGY